MYYKFSFYKKTKTKLQNKKTVYKTVFVKIKDKKADNL